MQSSLKTHIRELWASFGIRVVHSTTASTLQQMYASTMLDDLAFRCQSLSDRFFIAGRESDADCLKLLTQELLTVNPPASTEVCLCMLATLLACAQDDGCIDRQAREGSLKCTEAALDAIDMDQLHWHDVTIDSSGSSDEPVPDKVIAETPRVYTKQCRLELKGHKLDVCTRISTNVTDRKDLFEAIFCMLLGEPSLYFQIEFGWFKCQEESTNLRGAVRNILLELCDLATHIKKLETLSSITNADSFVQEVQSVLAESVHQFQDEVIGLQIAAHSTMTPLQMLHDIHHRTCLDELILLDIHTLDNQHDMVELCDTLQTCTSESIIACKLVRTLMRGYIHQCCNSMSGYEIQLPQVLPRCLQVYKVLFDTIGDTSKRLALKSNLVQFGRAVHCAGNACLASWNGLNDPASLCRFSKRCEEENRLRLAEMLVRVPLCPIYPSDLTRVLAIELDNLWAGHVVTDQGLNLALNRVGHKFYATCSELTSLGLIDTISFLQKSGENRDYSGNEPSINVFRRLLKVECLVRGLRSAQRKSRFLQAKPLMLRSWQVLEILLVLQSHMYAQLNSITAESRRLMATISTWDEVSMAHQSLTAAAEDALYISADHKVIKGVLDEVFHTIEQYVWSASENDFQTGNDHYRSVLDNVQFMTRVLEKDSRYIILARRLQYASKSS